MPVILSNAKDLTRLNGHVVVQAGKVLRVAQDDKPYLSSTNQAPPFLITRIRLSPREWLAGLPVAGLGVVLLISLPPLGVLVLGAAAALSLAYRGVEINCATRQYQLFVWLLGMRLGPRKALPAVARVVLKPHSDMLRYTSRRTGAIMHDRYEHFTLLLSVPGSVIGEVIHEFSLSQHTTAVRAGQQLADILQVPFVNLTDT